MSPSFVLKDPEEALVDDITLTRGDEPTELTDDQVKRLKASGAKLQSSEPETDPIDTLAGRELDKAVQDSGIDGLSSKTVDEKRQALKSQRDADENDGGGS